MFVVLVLAWRFFTGSHMDGKVRRHPVTGKVKSQFRNVYWNRIGRPRRVLWRLSVLGIFAGIVVGFFVDWWLTRFVLLAVSPFVAIWLVRYVVRKVAQKVTSFDPDGISESYWTLRPKYAQRLRRLREFRFHPFRQPQGEVITLRNPEGRAALADNAESGHAPVTSIRKGLTELIATEAAPRDGRSRTMSRPRGRRSK
jgi:hypothetical protein